MGMFHMSSSSYDPRPANQPDPWNYRIVRSTEIRGNLVIELKYPNCTTYEGRKVLLFRRLTLEKLKQQRVIDPHFSQNKSMHSPFARFEPTREGWDTAIKLAEDLS